MYIGSVSFGSETTPMKDKKKNNFFKLFGSCNFKCGKGLSDLVEIGQVTEDRSIIPD